MSDAAALAASPEGKAMASQPVAAVTSGESLALDDVYAAEIGRLVALGTVLSGDSAAGEDLAHDAFLQLTQRVQREPDYLHPPAWPLLRTMVVRLALQRRRAWAGASFAASRGRGSRRRVRVGEPSVAVIDWHDALKSLPPRMRATVVLFYGEDLSTAQTAAALGCSPRTVEIQLRAARRRLAAQMRWDDVDIEETAP